MMRVASGNSAGSGENAVLWYEWGDAISLLALTLVNAVVWLRERAESQ